MLQLGERVRVIAVSRKAHTFKGRTVWDRWELLTPLEGVICGFRVMAEGHTHNWGEDGTEFHWEKSVKAYLVAITIRRMVIARVEDVVSLAGEEER